ncbi:MAG: AmmeMemoRadiSam system protein B [Candidatus Hermodarchaeia archaeon]|jgi:AmmeMemoRadiSam system protein B
MGNVRQPSAFGFYPPDKTSLENAIKEAFSNPHGAGDISSVSSERYEKVIAGVAPHAGFVYSGPIASHLYNTLAQDGFPETFILIGPKHGYMRIQGAAVMAEGMWETPLGKCPIDTSLAHSLLKESEKSGTNCITASSEVHMDEHSLEVQLPFLQFLAGKQTFKILPLVISSPNYTICEKVGNTIAQSIQQSKRDVTIIASTDFTHYGKYFYNYAPVGSGPVDKVVKWVHETDRDLIHKIEHLDGNALLDTVVNERRTMCGASAVAATIVAAQRLGAEKGQLLKYATSYDVRGSSEAIVGYASVVLQR